MPRQHTLNLNKLNTKKKLENSYSIILRKPNGLSMLSKVISFKYDLRHWEKTAHFKYMWANMTNRNWWNCVL